MRFDYENAGAELRELRWSVKPAVSVNEIYRKTRIHPTVICAIEAGRVVPNADIYERLMRSARALVAERLAGGYQRAINPKAPTETYAHDVGGKDNAGPAA